MYIMFSFLESDTKDNMWQTAGLMFTPMTKYNEK